MNSWAIACILYIFRFSYNISKKNDRKSAIVDNGDNYYFQPTNVFPSEYELENRLFDHSQNSNISFIMPIYGVEW